MWTPSSCLFTKIIQPRGPKPNRRLSIAIGSVIHVKWHEVEIPWDWDRVCLPNPVLHRQGANVTISTRERERGRIGAHGARGRESPGLAHFSLGWKRERQNDTEHSGLQMMVSHRLCCFCTHVILLDILWRAKKCPRSCEILAFCTNTLINYSINLVLNPCFKFHA